MVAASLKPQAWYNFFCFLLVFNISFFVLFVSADSAHTKCFLAGDIYVFQSKIQIFFYLLPFLAFTNAIRGCIEILWTRQQLLFLLALDCIFAWIFCDIDESGCCIFCRTLVGILLYIEIESTDLLPNVQGRACYSSSHCWQCQPRALLNTARGVGGRGLSRQNIGSGTSPP